MRITPKGKGVGMRDWGSITVPNLFSSHGVLQLALWTTPVFHGAPEGYIYAPASNSKGPKLHACPQRPELFDALADALLWYEYRCRYLYDVLGYEMRCVEMENAIETLDALPTILEQLEKKRYSPENPGLKYQRSKIRNEYEYLKQMVSLLTENDYRRAGGPSQGNADRRSTDIKKRLVCDMRDAFQYHGPAAFRRMETYRSIVEILKAFGVQHQQVGGYTTDGVKQILRQPRDHLGELSLKLRDHAIHQVLENSKLKLGTGTRKNPTFFE